MRIADILLVIALALEVVSQCLGSSEIPQVFGVGSAFSAMKMLAVCVALAKITLFTKYTVTEFLFSIALVMASLLSWLYSGSDYVFIMTIFVVAAKNVEYSLICKTASLFCILSIAGVVIMSLIGLLPNIIQERSYSFGLTVERRSFGFQHVNFLGGYVLLSVTCILYLRKDRICILDYAALILLAATLYFYINSKTSAALLAITSFLLYLAQHHLSRQILVALCIALIACAIGLSFILPNIYSQSNDIIVLIDEILSKRLSFDAMFLNKYPILPFGQELELVSSLEAARTGQSMSVLDNTYLHLLLRFGLVTFVLYLVMYIMLLRKAIRNGNYTLLVMCTAILVCGIAEKWGFMVGYNLVLPALFASMTRLSGNSVESFVMIANRGGMYYDKPI